MNLTLPRIATATLVAASCLPTLARAATTVTIKTDTYIDNYFFTDGTTTLSNQRINYGSQGAVKAVSSDGSGSSQPLATSIVHGLIALPSSVGLAVGGNAFTSATLTYRVGNNGSLAGRGLQMYPLTHAFTAGTGGVSTQTMGGTSNDPTPLGADWLTYDGTNAWTTNGIEGSPGGAAVKAGGDYDKAATPALGVARTVGTATYYDWNLTTLLNDPTTRAEILTNGLLLKVTNETNYVGNQFVSLRSADFSTDPTVTPTFTFAALPEPTTLAVVAPALVPLRRRRKN